MKNVNLGLMIRRFSCCNQDERLLTVSLIVCGMLLLASDAAFSQTLVNGRIIEAINESPILGAVVRLYKGDKLLATAHSDSEGRYSLAFDLPSSDKPQTLTILVEHPGLEFVRDSKNIQIVSGKPKPDYPSFSLFPTELIDCRTQNKHCVIVGHFSPPFSGECPELSARIAVALFYDLCTRLQQHHIQSLLQPEFIHCDEANPRAISQGKNFARALGANAFISGSVKRTEQGYDIRTIVSDAYDVFMPPYSSSSESVNLEDPAAAQLNPEIHAAILIAIAAGYELQERFAEGVEATIAAEAILGYLTPPMKEVRERCKSKLPHQELLIGEGP